VTRPSFQTSRPLQALVDIAAMTHNLAQARARAGSRPIWAVVKANAYGHGIENAARGFGAADGLALLETDEAQRARAAGWRKPILLLEGVFEARDLELVAALELTTVVHCVEQIEMLEHLPAGSQVSVYLKVDTGMNRLGLPAHALEAARRRLAALPGVRVLALMTHLANADREQPAGPTVAGQYAALRALAPDWTGGWSVSNSAALFLHASQGAESVRPGITLYGASPAAGMSAAALGLKPAMRLQARILTVRTLARGDCVGYGSVWKAARPSRIAVVACGYADGYPRTTPEGTPVWVGGCHAPLVGRVSMDMLTVDVTEVPEAAVGAAVELWGAHVGVDDLAERVGTVGYELLAGLPARVREAAACD